MIRAVLLDIDGTLVLSNQAHARSWVDAFFQFGYSVEYDKVLRLIGMGGDKLIAEVRPGMSDSEGEGRQIKDLRSRIFLQKYAPELQPAPGARALLEELHARGLRLIAASSASQDELDVLLKAANAQDLLTEATTSDDADNSKPDPDIIQVALERVGVPASEALMIGDTPYDITAASKAGVRCVAVRCGGRDDGELNGAIRMYDDPKDLTAHLDEVLK